ncbi:hypothetical protein AB2L28_02345 [Kineococcus sp. TBRC 1896]|uniref:Condensin subunit ScpA n=1 Tax=Kineococcus mangrovi TaxID=1660183 RepID=A0ABV4HXC2_9ACTN
MPKKKKPRGHPARQPAAGNQLSPLRAGGRVLGDLQVPFRRFLEAERAEDGEQDPGELPGEVPVEDVEARLMESLGWLVLSLEADLGPAAAREFDPADLAELFTGIVPAVAEHNGLDPQELVDETRLAWTSYLMFLGETEQWSAEPEQLADCLDVASGGVGGALAGRGSVLDALQAAEAAVLPADRLADLQALDVVAAFLAGLDELAGGVDLAGAELPDGPAAEVLRSRLTDVPEVDPVALLLDLFADGVLVVEGGRAVVPEATDPDRRYRVATFFLASLVTGVLAACPSPAAIVAALSVVTSAVLQPMTAGEVRSSLEETGEESELPAALAVVRRLVDLGVLSPVEPWAARPGTAGAVLDVVEGFFRPEDGQG